MYIKYKYAKNIQVTQYVSQLMETDVLETIAMCYMLGL